MATLALLAACSGRPAVVGPPVKAAGVGASTGGVDSAVLDSGATGGTDAGCGRTTEFGDRICCGKPGELPGLSCIDLADGGSPFGEFGHCLERGEPYDARLVGTVCCTGLVPIDSAQPSSKSASGCELAALGLAYCSNCGDKVCDSPENQCNCPTDCE
ncbi:MAG: hypothetical protein RL701_5579 [Pseudomonadota bacterium]